MIITRISVRYARTLNLGNFESARFECEMTADLEPGEDIAQIGEELRDCAREQVKLEAQRLTEAMNS